MRAPSRLPRAGRARAALVDDVHTAGEDGMLAELAAEPNAEVRLYNRSGGLGTRPRPMAASWWYRARRPSDDQQLFVATTPPRSAVAIR